MEIYVLNSWLIWKDGSHGKAVAVDLRGGGIQNSHITDALHQVTRCIFVIFVIFVFYEISFDGGHLSILLDDPMQDLFNYFELDLNFEGTVGADLQLQSLWQSGRNKRARLIDPKCHRLTSHYIQTRLNFLTWLELRSGRLLVLGSWGLLARVRSVCHQWPVGFCNFCPHFDVWNQDSRTVPPGIG